MNSIQDQVTILNSRVDAIHQMMEQLNEKTAEVLSEVKGAKTESYAAQLGTDDKRHSYQRHNGRDALMEHKDVLLDTNYLESDSQSGDRALSPEIQIQRLTAQLTAAYNRIAALEEQLLLRRVHH